MRYHFRYIYEEKTFNETFFHVIERLLLFISLLPAGLRGSTRRVQPLYPAGKS
jgi:hypothetical protein